MVIRYIISSHIRYQEAAPPRLLRSLSHMAMALHARIRVVAEHGRDRAVCPGGHDFVSVLERQCLRRRIPDPVTLVAEVAAWEGKRNGAQATIRWQFTAADARIKLRRLYPELANLT